MTEHELIPGPRFHTASQALEEMASETSNLRGAVAFLTTTGARFLEYLLTANPDMHLVLTVRGAPITEPQALLSLGRAGANVRIVCGADAPLFHPKLWLSLTSSECHVLSGSGNATAGGFNDNHEQFEYFAIPLDAADTVAAHERRLEGFEQLGVLFDNLVETPYMAEWERQSKLRTVFDAEARELEGKLIERADSGLLDVRLYLDLNELYERTKAEVRIPDSRGGDRPYVATRFKQALERARGEGTLVPLIARMVKNPTEGLQHLAEAGRPDLMVESLVLDVSRPYHHRFNATTKRDARDNLDAVE